MGHFRAILGHFWPFLGHFVAFLDKFAESSNLFAGSLESRDSLLACMVVFTRVPKFSLSVCVPLLRVLLTLKKLLQFYILNSSLMVIKLELPVPAL